MIIFYIFLGLWLISVILNNLQSIFGLFIIIGVIFLGWLCYKLFTNTWGYVFLALVIAGWVLFYIIIEQKKNSHKYKRRKFKSAIFPNSNSSFMFFVQCTFSVTGYLCESKGKTTDNDLGIIYDFTKHLNLDDNLQRIAKEAFYYGQTYQFNLNQVLQEFIIEFGDNLQIIDMFLEMQIKICFSDGRLSYQEEKILKTIAMQLNISNDYLNRKLAFFERMYIFNDDEDIYKQYQDQEERERQERERYNDRYDDRYDREEERQERKRRERERYNDRDDDRYDRQEKKQEEKQEKKPQKDPLEHAYEILGVSANADQNTVKNKWRKLMKEHHPDKEIDLNKKTEKTKKSQEINAAFDIISKDRGWK